MPRKTKKTFDCLKFKWEQQALIYEEIKDMTPQEEIQYFRQAAESGPLGDWYRKLKAQQAKA